MPDLLSLHCKHYSKDHPPLTHQEIYALLDKAMGWEASNSELAISKIFKFKNYYQTTAFINAAIWIFHEQNHHPEINFTYNTCYIEFSTHSIGGLSLNDFICASLVNKLIVDKNG